MAAKLIVAPEVEQDLVDIARLLEAHPRLWDLLTDDLKRQLQPPPQRGT